MDSTKQGQTIYCLASVFYTATKSIHSILLIFLTSVDSFYNQILKLF